MKQISHHVGTLKPHLQEKSGIKTLVTTNVEDDDVTFDSDSGSWNVTRAQRACAAGKHRIYMHDVHDMYEANKNITVNPAKVAAMVEVLQTKPDHAWECVILAVENGKLYLIDGHHRLRAMHEIGEQNILGYVIEEADGADYRIYYNGQRTMPKILLEVVVRET